MALVSDCCICLRKTEYSETSQILSLFGQRLGLFRVIAKGAHRRTKAGASRFDGGVDLLDLGDAVMTDPTEKELATLTEWKLIDGHLTLRKDLRCVNLSLYAAELTGRMTHENDPQPQLFNILTWLLDQLPTDRREESFLAFQLELLRLSGFLPEVSSCVVCGQPLGNAGRVLFSPGSGGAVCDHCQVPPGPRIIVEARILRIIQTILKLPRQDGIPQRLPRLTRAQTDPANRLLADYIRHMLGHDLRLAGYVL
jgi:DNA repair protein RecO (recombination protein O)